MKLKTYVNEISDKDISNTFYVLRMVAIISVAAAHCGSFSNVQTEVFRQMLGTIGVPVFLIASGVYFRRVRDVQDLIKKKKIIVPWIVWGSLLYIIECLRGGYKFGLISWLFGYLTWLYYVPILLSIYIIFNFSTSRKYIITMLMFFLFSFVFSHEGIIDDNNGYFTKYQVPFNHIGFFAIGILLQNKNVEKIILSTFLVKIIMLVLFGAVSIFYFTSGNIGYWADWLSLPFEVLSFFVVILFSFYFRKINFFIEIGKRTYFIFFLHMHIGNYIVNKILIMLNAKWTMQCTFMFLLKPIVIVLLTYFIWWVIHTILKKIGLEKRGWIIAV